MTWEDAFRRATVIMELENQADRQLAQDNPRGRNEARDTIAGILADCDSALADEALPDRAWFEKKRKRASEILKTIPLIQRYRGDEPEVLP